LGKAWYFYPNIKKDVKKIVECCRDCQLDKGRSYDTRLYTPLLVPKIPWEDVRMDFYFGSTYDMKEV
jgi:hypothetical protein